MRKELKRIYAHIYYGKSIKKNERAPLVQSRSIRRPIRNYHWERDKRGNKKNVFYFK